MTESPIIPLITKSLLFSAVSRPKHTSLGLLTSSSKQKQWDKVTLPWMQGGTRCLQTGHESVSTEDRGVSRLPQHKHCAAFAPNPPQAAHLHPTQESTTQALVSGGITDLHKATAPGASPVAALPAWWPCLHPVLQSRPIPWLLAGPTPARWGWGPAAWPSTRASQARGAPRLPPAAAIGGEVAPHPLPRTRDQGTRF